VHLDGVTDPPAYWMRLCAQQGNIAYDVGANGGVAARKLAQRFDHVVAFEPADSFDTLTTTVPATVECVHAALSDHCGTLTLREAAKSIATGQLVTGTSSLDWGETVGYVDVPCFTLDFVRAAFGVPELVKVDVEGHETEVLSGAVETMREHRPTLMIEVHSRAYDTPIRDMLSAAKYPEPELLRHPSYQYESPQWHDHYYLVAHP
jgi:FkbM family methyltransferase